MQIRGRNRLLTQLTITPHRVCVVNRYWKQRGWYLKSVIIEHLKIDPQKARELIARKNSAPVLASSDASDDAGSEE